MTGDTPKGTLPLATVHASIAEAHAAGADLVTLNADAAKWGYAPYTPSGSPGAVHPAAPATPAGSAASVATPSIDAPAGGPFQGFSSTAHSDATKMLSWLQEDGAPADVIAAYAREHGLPVPGGKLAEIYAKDAAVGAAISEPEIEQRAGEYDWSCVVIERKDSGRFEGDRITQEEANHVELKQAIGRELATIGFDRTEGSTLINFVSEADQRVSKLSDAELELHDRSERIKLQKLWGSEFDSRAQQINGFISKLKPEVRDWLERSNALHDAMSLHLIWGRIQRGRQGLQDLKNRARS